jgi:hypothetical protein
MQVTCPNCKQAFLLSDALSAESKAILEKEMHTNAQAEIEKVKQQMQLQSDQDKKALREQMSGFLKQKEEETEALRIKTIQEAERTQTLLKKKLEDEMGSKIAFLEQDNLNKENQIKKAQLQELEIMQLQAALKNQAQQTELEMQKALLAKEQEMRDSISKSATEQAESKYLLQLQEANQKLDQQKKLIEDQQKKMSQGSTEQQGEAQENIIKDRLQKLFVFDEITDVKKGAKGADLVQTVRNTNGEICGTILYESKNTRNWSNDWVEKLASDMRAQSGDVAIIVSQVLPANIKAIGQDKGIWICGFKEFEGVAAMLRDGIIKVYESKKSQENKGDKMVMLYNFLNSNEFKQQWQGILTGFKKMKDNIDAQRNYFIKSYAEQDKIVDNILINGNTFIGNIKGIAGAGLDEVKMLE